MKQSSQSSTRILAYCAGAHQNARSSNTSATEPSSTHDRHKRSRSPSAPSYECIPQVAKTACHDKAFPAGENVSSKPYVPCNSDHLQVRTSDLYHNTILPLSTHDTSRQTESYQIDDRPWQFARSVSQLRSMPRRLRGVFHLRPICLCGFLD